MQGASEIWHDLKGENPPGTPFREVIRNEEKDLRSAAEQKSVIIVEDDQVVSLSLEYALKRKNYRVAGVFSRGADALAAVRTLRPDFVLMDILLDGELDGIQVAKFITEESYIPVIYLTGSGEEEMVERARGTNHFAFLIKPFKPTELYAAIELALERTRMEKELRLSEERYATTLRGINDAVIAFNDKGEVNYINPSAVSFLGTAEDLALGRKASKILRGIHDEKGNPVRLSSLISSRLMDEGAMMPNNLYYFRDGKKIPIDLNLSFTSDTHGQPTGGVVVFRDISRRKEEEIKWANLVVGAQETDRRKISESIHESLAQTLTAIRFNFMSMENQLKESMHDKSKMVDRMRELLEAAMEECRDISQHLSPKVLEEYGLAAALSELCTKSEKHSGIETEFREKGYTGIEKGREIILFRIAQELVENVIRHSGARNLRITLVQSHVPGKILFQVTDDGKGFDPGLYSEASVNSGFKNIQNRIVLLGGKSYFRTSNGGGTSFRFEVPS